MDEGVLKGEEEMGEGGGVEWRPVVFFLGGDILGAEGEELVSIKTGTGLRFLATIWRLTDIEISENVILRFFLSNSRVSFGTITVAAVTDVELTF